MSQMEQYEKLMSVFMKSDVMKIGSPSLGIQIEKYKGGVKISSFNQKAKKGRIAPQQFFHGLAGKPDLPFGGEKMEAAISLLLAFQEEEAAA